MEYTYVVDNGEEDSLHTLYFVRIGSTVIEPFFDLLKRAWGDTNYSPMPFLVAKAKEFEWFRGGAMDFPALLSKIARNFVYTPSDRGAAKQVLEQCRQLGAKSYALEPGYAESMWWDDKDGSRTI